MVNNLSFEGGNMRKLLFLISAAALLLSGCSWRHTQEVSSDFAGYCGEVMLYSSMQDRQLSAIKKGFEEKYPGITMNYCYGNSGKLFTRLNSEVQAGDIQADIIWTGNPLDYIKLKENRILSPYISPQAININPLLMDEHHYYVGGRIVSAVIAYNPRLLSEDQVPSCWAELLEPKWKGKIIMADPCSAGSSAYFMSALMNSPRYGENYFEKLRSNGCMLESGTNATHMSVAKGSYELCIGLDYVVQNLKDQGFPIDMKYPEKDSIFLCCPIGLVAGCPNERNARLLYDFILSKEGQEILVENNLRSIRDDVPQPDFSLDAILENGLKLDLKQLSRNENQSLLAFDRIFFIDYK